MFWEILALKMWGGGGRWGDRLALVHMQPPILGTSQHLGLVALEGIQHAASSVWAGPWVRYGSKLLLCCGVGVDAQGSYRGE